MREFIIFLLLCFFLFIPIFDDFYAFCKGIRQNRKEIREKRCLERKLSDDDIMFIRNTAYDEIIRKCRQLSKDGEVTYFSIEDLEKIAKNLKDRK